MRPGAARQSDASGSEGNAVIKEYISALALHVRRQILGRSGRLKNRIVVATSHGGDAQFDVDAVAEAAVTEFVQQHDMPVALYSEDAPLRLFGENPAHILLVDPIDGTRPAAAGLEMATISIAVLPNRPDATLGDVQHALVTEIKSGNSFYASASVDGIEATGFNFTIPRLSSTIELAHLFWSIEFNGHPANLMVQAYGHIIDQSANTGGVFVFNSATFSICKIITGQLDAYADIGNRMLRDRPELERAFRSVGNGAILHLFPYDIAAINLIAKKAGIVISDAYGESLDSTLALDTSVSNQRSCIAASSRVLHARLLESIRW